LPTADEWAGGWDFPAAFYFDVRIGTASLAFQEVSGLSVAMKTQNVQEGGENRLVHQLPQQIEAGPVVLKRAIAKTSDPLISWCKDVLEGDFSSPVVPQQVLVFLLDHTGAPARGWSLVRAYPTKWSVDGFNATKNELAIESVTLACSGIARLQDS
jgi:phage tail-like protein